MLTTGIDRRRLLLAGLSLALPTPVLAAKLPPILAYATRPEEGQPALVLARADGEVGRIPLPGRGHGFAWDPRSRLGLLFARRPGTWCLVFRPDQPAALSWLESPPGRHFYGHGCFSPDGTLLYTSENDYETAAGVIGIYDAQDDFRRLGELASGGVGPHDLCFLPEGKGLLIANGGIETHPDYGRAKLNLPEMRSSLTIIDPRSGEIRAKIATPDAWQRLSLRHLALDRKGRPWAAAQYEGQRFSPTPLVGCLDDSRGLVFAETVEPGWCDLEGYAASISAWGQLIAASFPRADRVLLWRAVDGKLLDSLRLSQVFALAADQDRLFAGGTAGGSLLSNPSALATVERIDNHACWLF